MATYAIINYKESFKGKMADTTRLRDRWSADEVRSSHSPTSSSFKSEPVSAALWPILRGMYGYGDIEVNMATSKDCGYAEIKDATGITQIACCLIQSDGTLKFSAAEATSEGVLSKYGASRDGAVLTAAYMALRISHDGDLEMSNQIDKLGNFAEFDPDAVEWDDPAQCDAFSRSLCILSQNLYYAAKDVYNDVIIKSVSQLRQNSLKILNQKGLKTVTKQLILINSTAAANSDSKPTKGTYVFGDPIDSKYEDLIPNMPDSFVPPKWVLNICAEIKESSDFCEPTRNILLSGPAGTGKTTGAMAIAYYTGKPYVHITCSPDTDMFDLVGQMLPNVDKASTHNIFQSLGLPTIDDVENDPKGAFLKLFGHEMGPLDSEGDCYREIFSRMKDYFEKSSDYIYIESNFIRAIENGWVVEIQEPNVIKRNSVLVGLNGIMENDASVASITLPTGKTIKRHRDATVIISSNGGYDGVTPLQQSVLSRIQSTYRIEQPEIDETVKRTMGNTGFPDQTALRTMCKVMFDMQKYCKEKDIVDGVCGPRELQNWAKKAMLIQRRNPAESENIISQEAIIQAAFPALLYKASQDEESVEEIITAVFSKTYDQAMVNEAKMLYNLGGV